MPTLRDCIGKAGKLISPADAQAMHDRARQYQTDGHPVEKAERMAVEWMHSEASSHLDSVYKQAGVGRVQPAADTLTRTNAPSGRENSADIPRAGQSEPATEQLSNENQAETQSATGGAASEGKLAKNATDTGSAPQVAAEPPVAPQALAASDVAGMREDQFQKHYQDAFKAGSERGITEDALDAGRAAKAPEAVAELKRLRDEARGRGDTYQSQYFNEAYEEATKTGSSAEPTTKPKPAPKPAAGITAEAGGQATPAELPQPPSPPNFETASTKEVDAWEQANRDFDKNIDAHIFGDRAEEYRRLQRVANGSNHERANAASDKISEMELGLSEAQQDILFGRKLPADWIHPDDAKSLRAAVADIDSAENGAELARASSRLIQGALLASKDRKPLEGRQAELTARVFRKAAELGVKPRDLVQAAFAHRAKLEGADVFELAGVTPEQYRNFISEIQSQDNSTNALRIQKPLRETPQTSEGVGRENAVDQGAAGGGGGAEGEGEAHDYETRLKNEYAKFDDTGESTIYDLVDAAEHIADDTNDPRAGKLADAVEKFREEQEDDRDMAGRGDMDTAEENFVRALQAAMKSTKAKKSGISEIGREGRGATPKQRPQTNTLARIDQTDALGRLSKLRDKIAAVDTPLRSAKLQALRVAEAAIKAGRQDAAEMAGKRLKALAPEATAQDIVEVQSWHPQKQQQQQMGPAEGAGAEKPATEKSKVPESLREKKVPADDIEYDVRHQNERMDEAKALIAKHGAEKAEALIGDKSLPADTRLGIGGQLIKQKRIELKAAKGEDASELTNDIQRIVRAMQSKLSTEAGQVTAMHQAIYKDLGTWATDQFVQAADRNRVDKLGGKVAQDAAEDAAKEVNAAKTEDEIAKAIERLKKKHTTKPAIKILSAIEKQIKKIMELKRIGALSREDMVKIAGDEIGIKDATPEKLKTISELADKVQSAKTHSDETQARLDLARELADMKGHNAVDLETSKLALNILFSENTQEGNARGNIFKLATDVMVAGMANPKYAGQLLKGLGRGIKTGATEAKSIWQTGRSTRDLQDKTMGVGNAVERAAAKGYDKIYPNLNKTIAKVLTMQTKLLARVGRFSRLADAMAYYPAREAYARMATAKLLDGDLKGKELDTAIDRALHITPEAFASADKQATLEGYKGISKATRVHEIIEDKRGDGPASTAVVPSERFGAAASYNQEPTGVLGVAYRKARDLVDEFRIGGVPVLRPAMMFLRTPTNMINESLDYVPLVSPVRAHRGVLEEGGGRKHFTEDERNQMYVKSLVGASLMAGMYGTISNGLMDVTFKGPNDPEKRRQWQAAGGRPFSFRIGNGNYHSYRDTPFLLPMAIVGYVNEAYKYNKDKADMFLESRIADAFLKAPIETTFAASPLTGMADLMNTATGGSGTGIERTLSGLPANAVIPGNRALMELDRTLDPKVYDSNKVQQTVPFLRRTGKVRSDIEGRPTEISPRSRFSGEITKDPLDKMLFDKQVSIPGIGRDTRLSRPVITQAQIEQRKAAGAPVPKLGERPIMSDDERDKFRELSGKRIRVRLQAIAPILRQMQQEEAQKRVNRITEEEREKVRAVLPAMAPHR